MQLDLNLRILAFLETSRTIPLEYPPRHPSQPSTDITMDDASSPSRPSTPATSNIREPLHNADSDEHLSQLFQLARELYECAENLNDPADRVSYQKELSVITSVMAYKDPEHSHLAKYYSQSRREQVAEQINSAILRTDPLSHSDACVQFRETYTLCGSRQKWRFAYIVSGAICTLHDNHVEHSKRPSRQSSVDEQYTLWSSIGSSS